MTLRMKLLLFQFGEALARQVGIILPAAAAFGSQTELQRAGNRYAEHPA